jgi:hypothetical protein
VQRCQNFCIIAARLPSPHRARLTTGVAGNGTADKPRAELALELRREHYPFFAGTGPTALVSIDVVALPQKTSTALIPAADRALDSVDPSEKTQTLTLTRRAELGGLLRGTLPRSPSSGGDPGWEGLPLPMGDLTLYFEDNALDDLYLVLRWQG